MKKYILFDHDGVLVDTEVWYFKATTRALQELGVTLSQEQYLRLMADGISSWTLAEGKNISKTNITKARERRNRYYQAYLQTKPIEIKDVLPGFRTHTSKPSDTPVNGLCAYAE